MHLKPHCKDFASRTKQVSLLEDAVHMGFLLVLLAISLLSGGDSANLVLGFMPVGLAYHALYSIVAAAFWFCVIKFAWPTHLEEWAEGGDSEQLKP